MLVIVATWLLGVPVLIVVLIMVVDVGNWFLHKRHLQLQADAGALAGGGVFTFPCSDDAIVNESAVVENALIEASVVGEAAVVRGTFRRVNVGDASEVYGS